MKNKNFYWLAPLITCLAVITLDACFFFSEKKQIWQSGWQHGYASGMYYEGDLVLRKIHKLGNFPGQYVPVQLTKEQTVFIASTKEEAWTKYLENK